MRLFIPLLIINIVAHVKNNTGFHRLKSREPHGIYGILSDSLKRALNTS